MSPHHLEFNHLPPQIQPIQQLHQLPRILLRLDHHSAVAGVHAGGGGHQVYRHRPGHCREPI